MDKISREHRSANMAKIRSRDTKPELAVRRFLYASGLRYQLHRKDLPGKPDIVFSSRMTCVFIHGCFWHGCPECIDGRRKVKSNSKFWTDKVAGNKARDARHVDALQEQGWKVISVWECHITKEGTLGTLLTEISNTPTLRPKKLPKAIKALRS